MSASSLSGRASSQIGPATRLVAVTPSDEAPLPNGPTRGLFVGGAGVLRVEDSAGGIVDLVSAGAQYHPISVVRIALSGTTATGIVALY